MAADVDRGAGLGWRKGDALADDAWLDASFDAFVAAPGWTRKSDQSG